MGLLRQTLQRPWKDRYFRRASGGWPIRFNGEHLDVFISDTLITILRIRHLGSNTQNWNRIKKKKNTLIQLVSITQLLCMGTTCNFKALFYISAYKISSKVELKIERIERDSRWKERISLNCKTVSLIVDYFVVTRNI